METLQEDNELQVFFEHLVSTYLNPHSQYSRVDLLLNTVAQNPQGKQLLDKLKKTLGVPVHASQDILGACLTESSGAEANR